MMESLANGRMLVIGAGFGRTGTNSLKEALEMIFKTPCYHMFEVIGKHREHCRMWVEIDDAIERGEKVDSRMFEELFQDYGCTVDFPSSPYYRQMMDAYPEAKVILTVRDAPSWLASIRATISPLPNYGDNSWIERLFMAFKFGSYFLSMRDRMWRRAMGQDIDLANDQMVMQRFKDWNEHVKQTVPEERLLVFNVKDGWEPLCRFLKVPIPNVPFPRVNARPILASRLSKIRRVCKLLSWVIPVIPALAVAFFWRRHSDHVGDLLFR